jgi:CO/xanthine dehydrogenase Mo-binding subunit
MREISTSVTKKDHREKMDGSALFVGDFPTDSMLFGKLIHSPHSHARVLGIQYPSMPEGYQGVDHRDILGENSVHVVEDDGRAFAGDEVNYIGDVVAMVIGPDEQQVEAFAKATVVDYEPLPAILDIDESDTVFFDYYYERGDTQKAFDTADQVFEENFQTSYQEQAYLEPQGMIASYADDVLYIHGSMQCPYYVCGAVAKVCGLESSQVRVQQDYTGGGFGGKEAYPSFLAAQAAVATLKAGGQPVRIVFDRREDMEFTSKRHPSRCHYRVAVKDGKVTAMEIDVRFNSGAFTTLTPVVLQRGVIAAPGTYNVANLKVHGRALKTNTVPSGAYRGFGAPQTFFAVELIMDHIAAALGKDSLDFKLANLVRQGDTTATGGRYHYPVPVPQMVAEVLSKSDYRRKRADYAQPQRGRFRRGIGIALWFHGAGFTGSGERDFIKAVTALRKSANGQVEILASNCDIGQGLKTTFSKIVAQELGIPYEQVIINNPDTSQVPDSGPTVASRSLMVVGELLRRAAIKLREQWQDGQEQYVEERYVHPDFLVPFDLATFSGDAYPTYAWGVSAVELCFDSLTGTNKIVGCWSSFDVGTPIDEGVVVGQMEGGVLQGLGYSSMEQMFTDANGRIRNNSYSDYLIPTSLDVGTLDVWMHVCEYPQGPYGAKGAGELPLVGMPAAFIAAAEQALDTVGLNHIPLTAEEALAILGNNGRKGVA